MGQLQPLGDAGEDERVIADHVAAAQGLDSDRAPGSLAGPAHQWVISVVSKSIFPSLFTSAQTVVPLLPPSRYGSRSEEWLQFAEHCDKDDAGTPAQSVAVGFAVQKQRANWLSFHSRLSS